MRQEAVTRGTEEESKRALYVSTYVAAGVLQLTQAGWETPISDIIIARHLLPSELPLGSPPTALGSVESKLEQ